jgi:hypothetical protein
MPWHYTVGRSFSKIISDGFIRPDTMYVPLGEKPIVWFSTEQFWEPTVSKGYRCADGVIRTLNMDRLVRENLELFRIGVDTVVVPFRWLELRLRSEMCPREAQRLASEGKAAGANSSRWCGTFEFVPSERWNAVEFFIKKRLE